MKSMNKDKGNYLKNVLLYAIPVLRKFDTLFSGRSLSFNYSGARLEGRNTGTEGFQKLADGGTLDKDLRSKFVKHVVPLVKG